ncbi:MAG: hypothetical protein JWP95_2047 [Actinotalea sp.]|nr:hypothetical protein [Actinotalea sp.]
MSGGPVAVLWAVRAAVAGATPTPEVPELREGLDPLDVSPGVLGFILIFAVVLACIPLFRSMTSKMRGVEYRDSVRGEQDGPTAPGGAGTPPDGDQGFPPPAAGPDDRAAPPA